MIKICIKTQDFKKLSIESFEVLKPYLEKVDYEACEYNFTTLYMWENFYNTRYYEGDGFVVLLAQYENEEFSIIPLADKDNMQNAFDAIYECFQRCGKKLHLRAVVKEFAEFLKIKYPNRFEFIEERDYFDYVYSGDNLRTLAGRKYQKKRNHVNSFLKEYDGRYEYRTINDGRGYEECIEFLDAWNSEREYSEELESERQSIKKVFDNNEMLNVKVGAVYIDGKMQAFSMGDYISEKMAVIHVEKANPDIRGLYPMINKLFLQNEFSNVELVNREEDLGVEGLRKAKLSYYPVKLVEKYTVKEI